MMIMSASMQEIFFIAERRCRRRDAVCFSQFFPELLRPMLGDARVTIHMMLLRYEQQLSKRDERPGAANDIRQSFAPDKHYHASLLLELHNASPQERGFLDYLISPYIVTTLPPHHLRRHHEKLFHAEASRAPILYITCAADACWHCRRLKDACFGTLSCTASAKFQADASLLMISRGLRLPISLSYYLRRRAF